MRFTLRPSPSFVSHLYKFIIRARGANFFCALLLLCSSAAFLVGHSKPKVSPRLAVAIADPKLDPRVEMLLKSMTLEEKVGQLVQYSAGQPTGPGTGRTDYKEMIGNGQIGSLLNVVDTPLINEYQHIAVEKTRLHIPILFGLDVIHGFRTEFPIPLGMASTWDPSLVERASRVAAEEASAIGIRWTFSPMVDIARDARWGRIAEGAGEDPFLGSAMAAAYVRGYQGSRLDAPDTMAACAKHYVGYGAAEGGRDYNTTEISEHTLRQYYLPPFHAAVDAGAATLMSAFNSIDGIPASANPFTLTQVLRKEWGFKGFVVSDWASIGELVPHGVAIDDSAAARKGFNAGVDVDMASSLYHDHLTELVKSGKVSQASIDESVRRVLRVKLALGLFEHPYVDESRSQGAFFKPASLELAQTVAEHSFVLLQNQSKGGAQAPLPIASDVKTITVIGPIADNPSDPENKYPSAFKSGAPSFSEELERRLGKDHVLRSRGTGLLSGSDEDIASAVAAANRADLVILTLGESPDMSGEAASRSNLGLPGRQQELLEAVVKTGKPIVLVLFSGRPLTVPWAFEHVPTVLAAWTPGTEAGTALARVLFGDVNPTGKLVLSWPRSVGQEPLYYNALSTGRPPGDVDLTRPANNADAKYLSRYLDEQNAPQFPFGYGLSYTTYSYSPSHVSSNKLVAAELNRHLGAINSPQILTVDAEVSNTGSRAGDEMVELYVRLQGTSTAQPVRALKGYQRVALVPGEKKKVSFQLGPDAFAVWNDQNQFVVEPSKVTIWISPDSASGTAATLSILP